MTGDQVSAKISTEVGINDLEKLRSLQLSPADRAELLASQTECTLVFSTDGGWATGVIVSFLPSDGAYWITATNDRRHITALAKDPRVSLVISSAGTGTVGRQMMTVRGIAVVHTDAATRDWFLPRFAAKMKAAEPEKYAQLLASPKRVVVEIRPVAVAASHDSRKMPGDGRGGPSLAPAVAGRL